MTAAVNYGLWYDFRNPQPWRADFETFYRERLDQIASAESLGFDSVWLTEHHFCDDGYTPSPLVLAGAIGASPGRTIAPAQGKAKPLLISPVTTRDLSAGI